MADRLCGGRPSAWLPSQNSMKIRAGIVWRFGAGKHFRIEGAIDKTESKAHFLPRAAARFHSEVSGFITQRWLTRLTPQRRVAAAIIWLETANGTRVPPPGRRVLPLVFDL